MDLGKDQYDMNGCMICRSKYITILKTLRILQYKTTNAWIVSLASWEKQSIHWKYSGTSSEGRKETDLCSLIICVVACLGNYKISPDDFTPRVTILAAHSTGEQNWE